MTIMARIYSRSNEQPPLHICRELKRLLSRYEQDTAVEFGNNRVWMAKMDIGAFGSPGSYFDADGGFSLLTGEPLIDGSVHYRASDLERLHTDLSKGDWSSTERTRGAFCVASSSPKNHEVRLITDRLGLRGFYYMVCDEFVLFATAFRIIAALTSVRKTVDLGAVAEVATFGMPLGDRTIFLR
jgi:hypothetical protein